MKQLTSDERLMVRVAVATCFAFPFDSGEVPLTDVRDYVDDLIALHRSNPHAATRASDGLPQDVGSTLEFCADRLDDAAPKEAARLRSALANR